MSSKRNSKRCECGGTQEKAWQDDDGDVWGEIEHAADDTPVWLCRCCGGTERRTVRTSAKRARMARVLAEVL